MDRFEANVITIPLYLDTAKTFIQLATGCLLLTVALREKVLGDRRGFRPGLFLIMSWFFLLSSILSGGLYQYRSVRFLESISPAPGRQTWFDRLFENPGILYGMMLGTFVLGASFFTLSALRQIRRSGPIPASRATGEPGA